MGVEKANLSPGPAFQDIPAGAPAVELELIGQSKDDLLQQLRPAKEKGCIGVVVEIVNHTDSGRVTTSHELEILTSACSDLDILFAVDDHHRDPLWRAVYMAATRIRLR